MCEECITPQSRRRIEPLYCGCGCPTIRRFLTMAEKVEMLKEYRNQLQKEIAGVEKVIEELKGK